MLRMMVIGAAVALMAGAASAQQSYTITGPDGTYDVVVLPNGNQVVRKNGRYVGTIEQTGLSKYRFREYRPTRGPINQSDPTRHFGRLSR